MSTASISGKHPAESRASVGVVNFQVTVLRVLASYPGRLATVTELKRDLGILACSGRDWAAISRRLAAGFPGLDIFGQGLVERYSFGWRLTERGARTLEAMQAQAGSVRHAESEGSAADVAAA